jgi:hypothetical protein
LGKGTQSYENLYVMKVINRTDVYDAKVKKRVNAECKILRELSFQRGLN